MASEEKGKASIEDGVMVKDNGKKKRAGVHCHVIHILIVIIVVLFLLAMLCALTYYFTKWRCATTKVDIVPTSKATLPTDSPGEDESSTFSSDYGTTEDPRGPWMGRLPMSVIPTNYDVIITPYLYNEDAPPGRDNFTFDGSVSINVQCKESTAEIRLHTLYLNISQISVFLVDSNSGSNLAAGYEIDEYYHFLIIELVEDLAVDSEYVINIDYEGLISEDLEGFYRISNKDELGEVRWGGVTQLQATYARRFIPCFDEPNFKATFDVTIRHRPDMTALSNGIELTVTDLDENVTDWKETVFKTTPKMSSYLLAIAVTHYDSMTKATARGTLVRVWANPESIQYAQYALDCAVNQTAAFESYFDYPYTTEKIDMLAVPDMIALAMENWGLIVYREDVMLYNPAEDKLSLLEEIVMIVAHELAHQWFGNLITPVWWDDIWLNEGFASHLEYIAADVSEPGWNLLRDDEMFFENDMSLALESDSDTWSTPVIQSGETPDEVYGLFNDMVYSKGACVLRMLTDVLGENVFRTGIRSYLREHAFGNVITMDLWDSLTQADADHGGNNVKAFMDSWTLQQGYPLLTVDRSSDTVITVSQQIFLTDVNSTTPFNPFANGSSVDQTSDVDLRQTWEMSMSHTHGSDRDYKNPSRDWIHGKETANITLSAGAQSTDWYLVNIGRYGFYRVNYDATNWNRLSQQLQQDHEVIPSRNRIQLLDDALTLFKINLFDVNLLLNMTLYLHQELDYLPWKSALELAEELRIVMKFQSEFGAFQKYWQQKLAPVYSHLNWDNGTNSINDSPIKFRHRWLIVESACNFGEENCLRAAKEMYAALMKDPTNNPIPQRSELRNIMYCYAIAQGGELEWEFGLAQLQQLSKDAPKSEHHDWLYGLSCATQPWLLHRLLQDAYEQKFQDPDAFNLAVDIIASRDIGLPVAWQFVQLYYDDIWDNYFDLDIFLSYLFTDVASQMYTEVHLKELVDFENHHEMSYSIKEVYQWSITQVKENINKRKKYGDQVRQWVSQQDL